MSLTVDVVFTLMFSAYVFHRFLATGGWQIAFHNKDIDVF